MVHSYEQAAAEAEHHGTDEAQLAEAMQYAVDEDAAAAGGEEAARFIRLGQSQG